MYARVAAILLSALLLCPLAATGSAVSAAGAVQGMPLLQRYRPDDYQANAGNLAILAAPDGMLYVGNLDGLLHFDGSHWDLLELPRRSNVRALALGRDGEVYIGGYDQFGVARRDAAGQLVYEDLRPRFGLDPRRVDFGSVWNVVRGAHGIWFRTSSVLFFLGDDGAAQQWPVDDALRQIYEFDGVLYARVHGQGLSRFVDGRFERVAGGERFATVPLSHLFQRDDGLLVVADTGFMLATEHGVQPLPSVGAELFAEAEPYSAIALPDGGYVLGTHSGELLHFDAALQLRGQHRLGAFSVLDLAVDREGWLWAATEADVVRLRVPSPWSMYGASDGLVGSVYDSAYHDGRLWVATSQGVYRSYQEAGVVRFELAIATALEANGLYADRAGLLVAEREGVLLLPPGAEQPQRVTGLDTAFLFRGSRFDADRLYVFGESELLGLRRSADGWTVEHRWPLNGVSIVELYEAGPHEFWVSDFRGGLIRWRLDPQTGAIVERREFGAAEGFHVDLEFGTATNELDGVLYATSGRRTFRREDARFAEVDVAPFNMVQRPWELEVFETPLGAYASTSRELLRRDDDGQWRPVHLGAAVARGYTQVRVGDDGMLRLVTWNGLLQFDPSVPEVAPPPLAVTLRSLSLRLRDGTSERLPLDPARPIELPAEASLQIDYRLMTMEPGSEFRFRVAGLIDEWSEWGPSSSPAITLRNPGPGRYQLQVEGRTRSGRSASPLALTIDAAPRWWQTSTAAGGAVLLLAVLIGIGAHLVARVRYRQFVSVNRKLERIVAKRTVELEAANRKLAELATEDSLTGVANRRALEQALLREWERCRELSQPLSVIMLDVDHFKQFNDVHGHLAGDQQLIRVARVLAEHVRPVRELLARFGGEEFALVLPGVTLEQAMQRAEAIRRSFAGGDGGATISAGVACIVPGHRQVPDDLVRSADMALYAAKRAGRNRVMAASETRVSSYV